jgi:polyisoprenoid-binding protein YceI
VSIDDKKLENSSVNVKIDPASIFTDNDGRDGHLKSPDFFDVAKFPEMTFVSKKVKSEGKGKLAVTGDLTMHGVTKEVTLAVTDLTEKDAKIPAMGPGMAESFHRGASATAKLSRKDFGLTWNKAIEAGSVAVGDEVGIELELELVKHVDAPAAAPATK